MTVTHTFGYTGGWQTYTVPAGITSITVTCDGAGSGVRPAARVTGNLAVSGGQVLYMVVGGAGGGASGATGGGGGWGAGGSGGTAYGATGGNGGGGYSAIRIGSTSGTVKCIAGGAGGDSGDGGAGGQGGNGSGGRGNAGSGSTTAAAPGASGGGGAGGTSSSGSEFNGGAGGAWANLAGAGGGTGGYTGPGGGGGGGGWGGGGGGCGGSSGYAPGGGGGGGASYNAGLSSAGHTPGGGGTGHGGITLVHADPNSAPNVPTIVLPTVGQHTLSTGSVTHRATVSDPNGGTVRALFRISTSAANFSSYTDYYSGYTNSGTDAVLTINGLATNTHYLLRCYAQDPSAVYSTSYDTADFYTNLTPSAPTSVVPAAGTSTKSMSNVAVSAVVSDPDGGTVRGLFRYTTDGFATYTDVYSAYVTSGTTASATLTGLTPNTHYQMYVYAEDPQGAFSSAVLTDFYMNRPPTAATPLQPGVNANLDSTIAQTFKWTFNDPDTADTQSAAAIQYRVVGDPTWIAGPTATTASQVTVAANTFTPNAVYEWQIQTTDAGGSVSPWSSSQYLVSSPPATAMSTSASMALAPLQTESTPVALTALAQMPISGLKTLGPSLAIPAIASLSITPLKTITNALALVIGANMSLVQSQTEPYALALQSLASLVASGTKTIDSTVVAMAAQANFVIQITLGVDPMAARAALATSPSPILLIPAVSLAAHASLASSGSGLIPSAVAMAVRAVLASSGVASRAVPLSMAVGGSLVQSGTVLLDPDPELAVRAQMLVSGLVSHSASAAFQASAAMVQAIQIRKDAFLSLAAHSGMVITGGPNQLIAIVPMSAQAGLAVISTDVINAEVHMFAIASLRMKDQQVVFEHAYLVVPSVNGSTMSFSASSYPNPRSVRNNPTIANVGNVHP